jgi:NADPH:quinone reductase-like Zn-dependent oxidoreductase
MSIQEAASIPCVFLTAWYALVKLARMHPGEFVLVHAAGSGVDTAAIQIARACGVYVLTSAGSESRVARGLELGAQGGVNYSNQDVASELQRLKQGRGVDVVLDSVGRGHIRTMQALAPGGRVVTIGGPAGTRNIPDPVTLQSRGQSVQAMGVFDEAAEDIDGGGWARLKAWFEEGTVRPIIDRVLPWTEADAAQRLLLDRSVFGKIVLTLD